MHLAQGISHLVEHQMTSVETGRSEVWVVTWSLCWHAYTGKIVPFPHYVMLIGREIKYSKFGYIGMELSFPKAIRLIFIRIKI